MDKYFRQINKIINNMFDEVKFQSVGKIESIADMTLPDSSATHTFNDKKPEKIEFNFAGYNKDDIVLRRIGNLVTARASPKEESEMRRIHTASQNVHKDAVVKDAKFHNGLLTVYLEYPQLPTAEIPIK